MKKYMNLLSLILVVVVASCRNGTQENPNFVIIMADDLGNG
ncbi:MAG: hypothetical protein ABFS38_22770 [Bacteroidota bacterium]